MTAGLWLVGRTFVVEAFRITSGSMENTLLTGDFLFVNKALYGSEVPLLHLTLPALREPERGDILVFDSVEEPREELIKRLVGIPGDTLAMRQGRLYRNGVAVAEPYAVHRDPHRSETPAVRAGMRRWQLGYLVGDTAGYRPDLEDWGPITVPADSYFVLGDNRDDSYDSRYWGFLPRQNVRGRPMLVYYSRAGGVRWHRFLKGPR